MVSKIGERIGRVIDLHAAPLLVDAGFCRERRTFRKAADDQIQIVNMQSHPYANFGDRGSFTVNLAIFFPPMFDRWEDRKLKGKPKPYDCALDMRLGHVMPERRDRWWKLDENSDDDAMAAELGEAVRDYGLPWLEVCSDPAGAMAYLEKLGWIETLLKFEIVYSGEDAARTKLKCLIESSYKGWLFKRPDKQVRNYLADTGWELGLL